MQSALDDNVPPLLPENFVKTFKAAGGECEYRLFENSDLEWVAEPALRPIRRARSSRPSSRAS